MSLYSDKSFRMALRQGDVSIAPYNDKQLQPSSYDVRLGTEVLVFDKRNQEVIDPRKPVSMHSFFMDRDTPFELQPGQMVLGNTQELVALGNKIAARLEGKSSLGRLGLLTHATAGFIDPGFSGHITLELANVGELPILLWPGMMIAQVCLFDLTSAVSQPYGKERGSHYQGQKGPMQSLSYMQFEEDWNDDAALS